mmetsp:Transcript_28849/g.68130  ORF Transcript_28849/g.68130 Transcript_28849/m.68130 type:complete len:225 (+) Transcript_28849:425-1099(+)
MRGVFREELLADDDLEAAPRMDEVRGMVTKWRRTLVSSAVAGAWSTLSATDRGGGEDRVETLRCFPFLPVPGRSLLSRCSMYLPSNVSSPSWSDSDLLMLRFLSHPREPRPVIAPSLADIVPTLLCSSPMHSATVATACCSAVTCATLALSSRPSVSWRRTCDTAWTESTSCRSCCWTSFWNNASFFSHFLAFSCTSSSTSLYARGIVTPSTSILSASAVFRAE